MRVAIMQPTYLPWSGYFGLMQSVDVFVLLDTVQFARRSWQQRNKIKTARGEQWLSVPVRSRNRLEQLIRDVELDDGVNFAAKHTRSIELNYQKACFFNNYASAVLSLLNDSGPLLTDLTIGLITELKAQLKIETKIVRASELNGKGRKADLLASLCQQLGASTYVSPLGSQQYLLESNAFKDIKTPVRYFRFNHPVYDQLYGDFIPNLSVIDMLFNCGDDSGSLIKDASEVL